MATSERILVTIPISHFCEKARWALERAGLDYTEKRHIQLVHWAAVKRAGGGRTAPVLRTADGPCSPSRAAILRYADEHTPPAQRLYPADAGERAEVVALERRFDTVLGPEGRRWLYDQVFSDARRYAPWNLTGVPGWERRMFPFVLAPAKRVIRRYLDVTDESVRAAVVACRRGVRRRRRAAVRRAPLPRRRSLQRRRPGVRRARRSLHRPARVRDAAAPARGHARGDADRRAALARAPGRRVRPADVRRGAPGAEGLSAVAIAGSVCSCRTCVNRPAHASPGPNDPTRTDRPSQRCSSRSRYVRPSRPRQPPPATGRA